MSSKLLKFNRGEDTYLKLADKYAAEGNLPRAMRVLKVALGEKHSPDTLLVMAENCYNNGIYPMAETLFLQLYPERDYRQDALLGLYLIALQTGDGARANHYVSELLKSGIDLSSEELEGVVQISRERAEEEVRAKYRVAYPEPDENKLSRANDMLAQGDRVGAIGVLSTINEGSPCFSDARCNAALADLMERDVAGAVQECLRALRADGENLRASAILVTAFYERGQTALANNLLERVGEIEPKTEDESISLAMATCQIGRHDLARKYFGKIKERKYDRQIMELLAVAQFNDGKREDALRTLSDLSAIYGECSNACMYRELIKSGERTDLPYYVELSEEVRLAFSEEVFRVLDEGEWREATTNAEQMELLGYALRVSEDERFVKRLAGTKPGRKYLQAYLMKPYVSEKNKVLVAAELKKRGETPYIMGVNLPTRLTRTPSFLASVKGLAHAYALAAAFIAMTQPSAVTKLNESTGTLVAGVQDFSGFRSAKDLAYILLAGMEDVSYLSDYFALLMGINTDLAKKYMERIVAKTTQTE